MHGIVVAAGHYPALSPLEDRTPAHLLPLVDRPFLQHVVEYLVDLGVTDFDFILSHMPEKIEGFLGDGTRWGSRFRFHLARDPLRPYGLLPIIATPDRGPTVFLAHADRLPRLDMNTDMAAAAPVLYCCRTEAGLPWSGWGCVTVSALDGLAGKDEAAVEAHLRAQTGVRLAEVPEMLSMRSFKDLLESNRGLLAIKIPGLTLSGTETENGIRLSRNVSLHPTATLVPPVYVGQNCRIGTGVRLGPNAVIGHDCVLDTRCTVADSVIFPGSYVGEALELDHVLIDKNRLVNVKVGATVSVTDDFILSGTAEGRLGSRFRGFFSRLLAVLLLVLGWPLLLLTALCLALFRSGPVLMKRTSLRLPAPADPAQWKTFELWSFVKETARPGGLRHLLLTALPQLVNIARGESRFVGVMPRSREQVRGLPHDWQALYLRSKAGIVTEAFVQYGPNPTEDEIYSAEVFYSVRAGLGHDLKLLAGYATRVLGLASPAGAHDLPGPGARQDD